MNMKPSARKTHRKTRTGCRTCKQRKIKCDEQRPSCHNCIKHSVQCDFLVTQSIGNSISSGATHTSPGSQHTGTSKNGDFSFAGDLLSPNLNLMDLELLHNYITSTSNTLHTDAALKILWRINVPQLGFQYEFVMRGILALSALHLAHYKAEKKGLYIQQAMLQHQMGLRMATGVLSNVTQDNCTAVYLFSALTLFFTFANPRKADNFLLVGENSIADWFFLVKGTSFIIDASEDQLFAGTLGPMFLAGQHRSQLREEILTDVKPENDPLAELTSLIQANHALDPITLSVYIAAINDLRRSFAFFYKQGIPGFESGDIFIWVFRMTDGYLELVRQQTQESLVIFGYFCVVLRRLDFHWWMEGWSMHLISKIYALLDEEHRLWLRWPIEEIGWIPQ